MARAQLEQELRQCDVLWERYPEVWSELTRWGGVPRGVDPDRARRMCQRFGLPCVRPCTEVLRRLSGWELAVPAAVGMRMERTSEDEFFLRWLPLSELLRLSPTTARMAARAAPVRGLFPRARNLPVLLPGDTIRLADSPVGERVFAMGMRSRAELGTTADGWIRVVLRLYKVGAGRTLDAAHVLFDVPPFPPEVPEARAVPAYPTMSREALRGDLGLAAQRLAMRENAYVFARLTDIGAPYATTAITVSDDDPPQYVLHRAGLASDYLVAFFERNGFPFDGLFAVVSAD